MLSLFDLHFLSSAVFSYCSWKWDTVQQYDQCKTIHSNFCQACCSLTLRRRLSCLCTGPCLQNVCVCGSSDQQRCQQLAACIAQVVLACFLATFVMYLERVGFSIAFSAMAKQAALTEAGMGHILSAFYWGYGLSQVGLGSSTPAIASIAYSNEASLNAQRAE